MVPEQADVAAVAEHLVGAGIAVTRDDGSVRAADPWGTALRLSTVR